MKRLDDLTADTKVDFSGLNVEKLYEALVRILKEKENVKIKYSVRKKTPEELAEDAKKREPFESCMEEVLGILTDQELHILGLRFGYNNIPKSQKDIGDKFGISRADVGKLEKAALEKLREPDLLKKLHPFLYQALDFRNFYSRLFVAIFKLKKENVDNILKTGPSSLGEDQIYLAKPNPVFQLTPECSTKLESKNKKQS